MFVGEVMVKLLLAQPSNERCECFASLVIQHLECQQLKNEYLKRYVNQKIVLCLHTCTRTTLLVCDVLVC